MRFKLPGDNGENLPMQEVDIVHKLREQMQKLPMDPEKIKDLTTKLRDAVVAQRNDILRAFIAQHGCLPDEAVQCEQSTPKGYRWYVRKRTEEEMKTGRHE